jgi:hypothetical protein
VGRLNLIVLTLIVLVAAGMAAAGAPAGPADDTAGASAKRITAARGAVRLFSRGGKPLKGRWQSWADESLMPTPRMRVKVVRTGCPAERRAAGCVYTKRPRVIYLRERLRDPRGVFLHELGHIFDLRVMNNRDRGRFRRIMDRSPRRKWWRGRMPLAEHFAEAYSWCARYTRIVSISRYSSYRYRPSKRQHRRICALIVRAARDRAQPVPPSQPPPTTNPDPDAPAAPSTAPGVVPGDPERDPGPQPPEDPDEPEPEPTPEPLPIPLPEPPPPLPIPTATPTPPPPYGLPRP